MSSLDLSALAGCTFNLTDVKEVFEQVEDCLDELSENVSFVDNAAVTRTETEATFPQSTTDANFMNLSLSFTNTTSYTMNVFAFGLVSFVHYNFDWGGANNHEYDMSHAMFRNINGAGEATVGISARELADTLDTTEIHTGNPELSVIDTATVGPGGVATATYRFQLTRATDDLSSLLIRTQMRGLLVGWRQ